MRFLLWEGIDGAPLHDLCLSKRHCVQCSALPLPSKSIVSTLLLYEHAQTYLLLVRVDPPVPGIIRQTNMVNAGTSQCMLYILFFGGQNQSQKAVVLNFFAP